MLHFGAFEVQGLNSSEYILCERNDQKQNVLKRNLGKNAIKTFVEYLLVQCDKKHISNLPLCIIDLWCQANICHGNLKENQGRK